jgi:hypothetical protein
MVAAHSGISPIPRRGRRLLCNHPLVNRVITAAAAVVVLASGCGTAPQHERPSAGASTGSAADKPATSVTANGVYKAGTDLAPGVYTTRNLGCVGYTASTADFDIEDADEPDTYLAGAVRVGDVQRIVVHDAEFFTSKQCDTWRRENDGDPKSADPATLRGGCQLLVGGDDLVGHVVSYLREPATARDTASAYELQDRLMAPVDADNRRLANAAGELVDALDNPSAYVTAGGDLYPDVVRAVARIRSWCEGS